MEASTINSPHPDDEAESFFGPASNDPTPGTFNPVTGTFDADAAEEAGEYEKEQLVAGLTEEQMRAEAEAHRARTGEPEMPSTQTAAQTVAAAARAAAEPGDDEDAPEWAERPESDERPESAERSARRQYIIFQPVALTANVLRKMLSLMEAGEMPEARVAFFELDRVQARTDKEAVGLAYREHQESLPERPDLYGVTARAFRKRSVAPRERRVEDHFQIT